MLNGAKKGANISALGEHFGSSFADRRKCVFDDPYYENHYFGGLQGLHLGSLFCYFGGHRFEGLFLADFL